MKQLAWIFVFLPLCFGVHEVSNETCMNLENSYPTNFSSLVNGKVCCCLCQELFDSGSRLLVLVVFGTGSTLNVCSQYLQDELQCCSQSDEDALGMTLNNDPIYLGIDLRNLQVRLEATIMNYVALSSLQISLINDILRPLMTHSVDRTVTAQSFDSLDMISKEVLDNFNSSTHGNTDVNVTEEMIRYFTEGISAYYVNLVFNVAVTGMDLIITPSQMDCAINAIYQYLFPPVEQAKIASLGNNLQQIAVAFEVAGTVISSIERIRTDLRNFNFSSTCTNVWTHQYACPLCVGQTTPPLCRRRCVEVLKGCTSPLQQMIVQLNVLLEFVAASVNSLVNGDPYANININNVGDLYISAFETSLNTDLSVEIINDQNGANCGIGRKKRSVDNPLVRHKRQSNVELPEVAIDQSSLIMINDTLQSGEMNVSLDTDRSLICSFLMAHGSDHNCTIGVDNVSPYMSTFDKLEISDQVDNPTGDFNLTELREQARSLTYIVTELLTNRSDIMMLYGNVLPGRDIPNLDFLNEPTPSPTISISVSPNEPTPSPTISMSVSPNEPTPLPTISMNVSPIATDTPRPRQPGGDATAVSFSSLITLAALLFTSVFVN